MFLTKTLFVHICQRSVISLPNNCYCRNNNNDFFEAFFMLQSAIKPQANKQVTDIEQSDFVLSGHVS